MVTPASPLFSSCRHPPAGLFGPYVRTQVLFPVLMLLYVSRIVFNRIRPQHAPVVFQPVPPESKRGWFVCKFARWVGRHSSNISCYAYTFTFHPSPRKSTLQARGCPAAKPRVEVMEGILSPSR